MPPYTMPVSEEMREWFDQGGRRIYESWVITRLDSYTAFIPFLHAPHVGELFRETYFARGYRPGPGESIAEIVWWSLGLPFAFFLSLLALPWIDYRIRGQIGVPAAMAALLVPITYMVGFVTYHGAGSEEYRHMLIALVLYRIAFIFAGWSLLTTAKIASKRFAQTALFFPEDQTRRWGQRTLRRSSTLNPPSRAYRMGWLCMTDRGDFHGDRREQEVRAGIH